ncbi:MAG: T9SS type A sorting domain-containing protein [Bacteroidales bacterium]|nr:T9SS type A sorting domain-containing protein [Bacteroidales bacterium]
MRFILVPLIFLFQLLIANGQQPSFEWVTECGNPPNTTDAKTDLAPDNMGGFYFAGEFVEMAEFGAKTILSSGGTDVFLVKLDADGSILFANRLGGVDEDYLRRIKADDAGNLVVLGYFYGTTQIGNDTYTSFGSQDIFVAKYDSEGEFLWSFRAGGMMADYASDLAIDHENNIIITGHFYGQAAFGDTVIMANGSSDVYLAKLNPDGDLMWVTTASGSSSDQARSVDCGPDGTILISGSFYSDISFGDTTLQTTNPVGNFVSAYQAGGQLNWAFQLNGTYLTTDILLAAASNGDFYISGNFSETIHFGNKTFEAGPFNEDIYVAKYEADGKLAWARHGFSPSGDHIAGMSVDMHHNLYVTGHFLDTIQFGLLTIPYTLCCGSREIFIVNYTSAGDILWGEQITGPYSSVHAIAMNNYGNLVLSGWFTGDVLFGPLSLSNFIGYHNFVTGLQTEMFTAIRTPQLSEGLRVFPNPALDKLTISYSGNNPLHFNLYDISGRIILMQEVSNGENIEINALPAGYYLYRAVSRDNGPIFTGKIIRQN